MRTKDALGQVGSRGPISTVEQPESAKPVAAPIELGAGSPQATSQADAIAPGWRQETRAQTKPGQTLGDVRARLLMGEKPSGAEKVAALSSAAIESVLSAHSESQWFTGKGRPIERAQVTAAAPLSKEPSGQAFFSLIDLRYQDGGRELFQVPLVLGAGGSVADGLEQQGQVRALVEAMRDGASIDTTGGALKAETTPGSSGYFPAELDQAAVKRLKGPQSNFSYRVGDGLIYKSYARPEPDVSIEREMTAHLTAQGYTATPRLVGTLTLEADKPMTVGLLFEFAKNEGDGWAWLLNSLGAGKGSSPEVLDRLELLGQRIGEMHQALGAPTTDGAFTPEPIGTDDLKRWASTLSVELALTLDKVALANPSLSEKLEACREALEARISQLASVDPSGLRTRIHGDLHLGQLLVKDQDWLVLDFEGEPARTKAERREKYTPLRDVAGMLRSFAYAQAQAEKDGAAIDSDWAAQASARFLAGYGEAVAGTELLPKDEASLRALLDASELEKALYEVRYELQSRPDWVGIPAKRLIEIAAD